MLPSKTEARAALRAALEIELGSVERVAAMARDEASSAETRQEGKYDTRATEASYLARGQAERVASLRRLRAWFDLPESRREDPSGVAIGSLVILLQGQQRTMALVVPTGGLRASIDALPVLGISPRAPLGAAMLGLEAGDAFEVRTPGGVQVWEVESVV